MAEPVAHGSLERSLVGVGASPGPKSRRGSAVVEFAKVGDRMIDPGPVLGCLLPSSPPRRFALACVRHPWFEPLSMLAIVVNSLMLCLYDPIGKPDESPNRELDRGDLVLQVVFTLELLLRLVALGWGVFWQDLWYRLDLFVVLVGFASFVPSVDNFSAARTLRVFRPLRAISKFPGMRIVVASMLGATGPLLKVALLAMFIFFVFGIVGLQLYVGVLDGRCMMGGTGSTAADVVRQTPHVPDASAGGVACAMWNPLDWPLGDPGLISRGDGNSCDPIVLGSGASAVAVYRYCARANWAAPLTGKAEFGTGSFDNIGAACLSIFTSITLEGWVDIAYALMDSFPIPVFTAIYFVMLILIGSLFLLNLTLAVIQNEYHKAKDELARAGSTEDHGEAVSAVGVASTSTGEAAEGTVPSLRDRLSQWVKERHEATGEWQSGVFGGGVSATKPGHPGLRKLVEYRWFQRIVVVAILLNTVVLALEFHYPNDATSAARGANADGTSALPGSGSFNGMSTTYQDSLETCNYCFAVLFFLEMILKVAGLGWREYVSGADGSFNCFDATVVLFSVIEIIVKQVAGEASSGVSALRSLRLFRVFKLAKSWKTLQRLLATVTAAITGVANVSVVLSIIIFIFTLLGMQLFGGAFPPEARHHFNNFWWAFVTVFQVLTGENWNEVLYEAIGALGGTSGWLKGVLYFAMLNIVGAYIVLNLFLAILLEHFEDDEEEDAGLHEATAADASGGQLPALNMDGVGLAQLHRNLTSPSPKTVSSRGLKRQDSRRSLRRQSSRSGRSQFKGAGLDESSPGSGTKRRLSGDSTRNPNALLRLNSRAHGMQDKPSGQGDGRVASGKGEPDLMMDPGTKTWWLFGTYSSFRMWCFHKIQHRNFDRLVLLLIAISSLLLALDEPYLTRKGSPWKNSAEVRALELLDITLACMFLCEMLLKVTALGFARNKHAYLRNPWNALDCFIVVCSFFAIAAAGNSSFKALRSLRALRALRPLRVISRNPGMKLVVNSVFRALPDIANTTVVCVLFYTVFAIIGVQNFAGSLGKCNDPSRLCNPGVLIPAGHPSLTCGVSNACSAAVDFPAGLRCGAAVACDPSTSMTLDKAGIAADPSLCGLLATRELTEACETLAYCALAPQSVDCAGAGRTWQVRRRWESLPQNFNDVGSALLTVFEVSSGEMWPNIMYNVVDSVGPDLPMHTQNNPPAALFFIFVTVVCSFLLLSLFVGVVVNNYHQMQKEGISLITDDQRIWIQTQEMALECGPIRKNFRPVNRVRSWCYDVCEHPRFELGIMVCILLNVLTMAMRFFDEPAWWGEMLRYANFGFIGIFSLEMVLKLAGLGTRQYFSQGWCRFDFSLVLLSFIGILFSLQQFATLLRVLRVARMFRLMRANKDLLNMFKTLVFSLPSIANVATVLLLLYFVYACIGMGLFADVRHGEFLNRHANFDGFWNSMFLLFRMSTGESYNGIMHDAMVSGDKCNADADNCGSALAPIYFLSFFIFSALTLLNLLVAIILDNFEGTMDFDESPVQDKDLDLFKHAWAEFDNGASGFLTRENVVQVLALLPPPLGVASGRSCAGTVPAKGVDRLAELDDARSKLQSCDLPHCDDEFGDNEGGHLWTFNEVLSALAALATPEVKLPSDLLGSDMMKELYAKNKEVVAKQELQKKKLGSERAASPSKGTPVASKMVALTANGGAETRV